MSLIYKAATEIKALLDQGDISPLDLVNALETRIDECEGAVLWLISGRAPAEFGGMPSQPFGVAGPMARDVPDVALLLDGE